MATASVDIGTLIYKDPKMHSGRPCITGTGTTVLAIVALYKQGMDPREIHSEHRPDLPLEGIFAALAYWQANPEEIEEYFAEDALAEQEWIAEKAARAAEAAAL